MTEKVFFANQSGVYTKTISAVRYPMFTVVYTTGRANYKVLSAKNDGWVETGCTGGGGGAFIFEGQEKKGKPFCNSLASGGGSGTAVCKIRVKKNDVVRLEVGDVGKVGMEYRRRKVGQSRPFESTSGGNSAIYVNGVKILEALGGGRATAGSALPGEASWIPHLYAGVGSGANVVNNSYRELSFDGFFDSEDGTRNLSYGTFRGFDGGRYGYVVGGWGAPQYGGSSGFSCPSYVISGCQTGTGYGAQMTVFGFSTQSGKFYQNALCGYGQGQSAIPSSTYNVSQDAYASNSSLRIENSRGFAWIRDLSACLEKSNTQETIKLLTLMKL